MPPDPTDVGFGSLTCLGYWSTRNLVNATSQKRHQLSLASCDPNLQCEMDVPQAAAALFLGLLEPSEADLNTTHSLDQDPLDLGKPCRAPQIQARL